MCELCDTDGSLTSCQDCGRLICFDIEPSNIDVIDQAYTTMSGDLFCRGCGSAHDRRDEEQDLLPVWERDDYSPGC